MIKRIKYEDRLALSKEVAINSAEKQLKETDKYAAIYGEKVTGIQRYFVPILVDEETLKDYTNRLLEKDPNARVYALYKGTIGDVLTFRDAKIYQNNDGWKYFYSDLSDMKVEEGEEIWETPSGDLGTWDEVIIEYFKENPNAEELPKEEMEEVLLEADYTKVNWNDLDIFEFEESYEPDWY